MTTTNIKEITVKNYLRKIKKNNAVIKKKKFRIMELDAQRKSITAQMGGERVQTSPQHDKMAKLTAQIEELQEKVVADTVKYEVEMQQAIDIIEQVETENQFNLLYAVYVEFKLLKQAAAEYGIHYDNARTIHGDALEYIRKYVPAPAGYKFIPKPKKQ